MEVEEDKVMSDANPNDPTPKDGAPKAEAPKKRRGKPPKYETSYRQPGRPPRSPKKKVGRPLRFLVTVGLEDRANKIAEEQQLLVSDLLRLALYRYLEDYYKRKGEELPADIRTDSTFDTLRGQGFV